MDCDCWNSFAGIFSDGGGTGHGVSKLFFILFFKLWMAYWIRGGVCCVCFCELCVEVPILAETEMKWKGKGRVERSRR